MTTTVTVEAHCDPEKTQVRIRINEHDGTLPQEVFLESGEQREYVVYDYRSVSVDEIPK